jgi:hypothetical protein
MKLPVFAVHLVNMLQVLALIPNQLGTDNFLDGRAEVRQRGLQRAGARIPKKLATNHKTRPPRLS